jgi:ERCC4-related helicase
METNQILQSWEKLPFSNFYDESKKAEWKQYALKLIANLAAGNTGLIADTGTGKTIMAVLAFEALQLRTLFIVPTVILAKQHADLYRNISANEANVITGQKIKRDWNQRKLVIATPHVFMVDYKKGLVNENYFDFLIVDEMHKGQGEYPYVPIARIFNQKNKKLLCLSASPGASYEEIHNIEKTYNLKQWVTAEIEKPISKHRLIKTELSIELKEVEIYLKLVYLETLKKLIKVFEDYHDVIVPLDENNPFLTQDDNNRLEKIIERLPSPEFYEASSLFARQHKIAYLYRLLMTESYFSFLSYVEKSLASDKSKAAKTILDDNDFRKMYWSIKNISKRHPKEDALLDVLKEMDYKNKSCLVFVSSKKTAIHLSDMFEQLGYKTGTLTGGANKSPKKQAQVIEDFSKQKIKIIFATSVVEEGLSLPDIDAVIHYNQPLTEISRLQKGGRTGRFHEGLIIFMIMNIPYENALYYATLARLKKMKNIFYESARQETREKKSNKKRKKVEITGQLSFNFSGETLLF